MENKKPSRFRTIVTVLLNLLIMTAVLVVLGWIALVWIDSFTLHGKTNTVPDVKGMDFNAAAAKLEQEGLVIELSDSIFSDKVPRGAVIEQNPKGGAVVKPGRVVYVTINAFSPKMVAVPQLTDISVRQARSILEGLGIKSVREVSVISEYKDLVLGAKVDGHRLMPGARVPVTATIVLEVGDGLPDLPDSIMVDSMSTGEAAAIERVNIQ